MKIGIISMQRVINYGSFLQAYALKSILEGLGHEVRFVDIKKGIKLNNSYTLSNRKNWKFDDIFMRIQHVLFSKKRIKLFNNTFFPMIQINSPVNEEDCEFLVIGSDEVFNCSQNSWWGISLQLFGNTNKPTITYAASAGYSTLESINKTGMIEDIKESLGKLLSISVRDDNTRSIINKLGLQCTKNVDPVFLYNWDLSIPIKTKHKFHNYILIYAYDNRINDVREIDAIKMFAKKNKLLTISFGVFQRWCDKNILCSPLELIKYFDMAEYVITDTFHGTVISIKRNKKFATIIRESNRNKIHDLLYTFGLDDRSVQDITMIDAILTSDICYEKIQETIASKTSEAISYLQDNIQ